MFSFNKIIKTLILTDLAIFSGWGLILPVFAIYIVQNIEGGNAQTVGIAAGIYFVVKAIAQIPIGSYLDIHKGERDDFWFMLIGAVIVALVPLGYLVVHTSGQIYLLQMVYAIGGAMYSPPWGGIFTRHIDKDREASTWSTESAALGLGMGIAGIIGGTVVEGAAGYFFIKESLSPRVKTITFPKH
jgi:MFS family permease